LSHPTKNINHFLLTILPATKWRGWVNQHFGNFTQSSMQFIFPFSGYPPKHSFRHSHDLSTYDFPSWLLRRPFPKPKVVTDSHKMSNGKQGEKLILMIYHSQMMSISEVLKMPQRQLFGRFLGGNFHFWINDISWQGVAPVIKLHFWIIWDIAMVVNRCMYIHIVYIDFGVWIVLKYLYNLAVCGH